jgi:Tol biopolymer transport system component
MLLAAATPAGLAGQAAAPRIASVPTTEPIPSFSWWAESPDGRFLLADSDAPQLYDRSTRRWEAVPGAQLRRNPVWSPNGRFIAYAMSSDEDRTPYLWIQPMDSATARPNGTARRVSNVRGEFPSWSPDSRRLAFVSRSGGSYRLMTIPFNGGDPELLYESPGNGAFAAWSPDGQFVSSIHNVANGPTLALRVNVATRRAEESPAPPGQLVGYSRDGSRLAYHEFATGLLTVTSPADGRVVGRFVVPGNNLAWSRSSPDELLAREGVMPEQLQRLSLPSGQVRTIGALTENHHTNVAFSPDGTRLAYVRESDGVAQVMIASADGSGARALGQSGSIDLLTWSPAGTHLAYRNAPGGALRVIEVASGTDRALVQPTDAAARLGGAVGWRSDGQAVRYVWRPQGPQTTRREVREVTLAGADRLVTTLSAPGGFPTIANDTLLLLMQPDGVDAVSLRSGELRRIYSGTTRNQMGSGIGFSRDGEWIVFVGSEDPYPNNFPVLLSLRTGQTRRLPNGLGGEIFSAKFHPDGMNLVTQHCLPCASGEEKWDFVLLPMNGDPARVLTADQREYRSFEGDPAISPDGSSVIWIAEKVWDARLVTLRIPGSR